jgi:hypothetical protein
MLVNKLQRLGPSLIALAARAAIAALLLSPSLPAHAALTFNVAGSWPNDAHRTAAVNAMQSTVNRYNAYGDFGNYNVYVYYNAGIPTAQANYLGSIGFGGTYPNERVAMHELAHYLGSGTYGDPWDGAYGEAQVDQFDGLEATLNGDSAHFWPYGLNYDSEGSEINKQRAVAMIYAQRADMGIGPTAHPATATAVTMTASDPVGTSGFNYKDRWNDGYFPHANADYSAATYILRTPASANSFNFVGKSLTLSNPTVDTGLFYNGTGSTGVTTFNNLIVSGGWIDHRSPNNLANVFRLDGLLTVASDSNIRALDGEINILADVAGAGTLTIHPTNASSRENNRYVRFFSSSNEFTGTILNNSRFELANGANFTFKIGALGVNNAIAGASARVTALNGRFEFDVAQAEYGYGNSWQLVTAANTTYGATFNIPGFVHNGSLWSDGSFTFDQATGLLTATPGSDLNDDGIVNIQDWLTFATNHLGDLSSYSPEERAARGDIDGDGDNDHADFLSFHYQYDALNGAGAFAAMYASLVPEPTAASLALGAAAFAFCRRRRGAVR